ncbi:MAG: malonate decarboxylase subunit epsilon [Verrucomicrobia bacterium]|nr:malonate decarboxylase subunit epsilon [Verrucomicrobiota bacterium]
MSVAFLFPGQGSQHQGMLHDLPACASTAVTLEEASRILSRDIFELDSEVALRSTVVAQLALLITEVVYGRALISEGAVPNMVGGLSVGSYAAAVIAESLDLSSALTLVRLRGELMEKVFPHGHGMVAITGLDEKQVSALVAEITSRGAPIFLANVNAPRQIVVSGALAGLEKLMEKVRLAGGSKAQRLDVAVPSHCQLLNPIAEELDRAAAGISLRDPKYVYVGNRSGRPLRDSVSVRDDLVSNVAHTVRWHDATTLMFELGARLFLELPPGCVLTKLAATSFPEARAIACAGSRVGFIAQLIRKYHQLKPVRSGVSKE